MKITRLPNGTTTIELDDTPSGDVMEKIAGSGDPVATEKRADQITPEPTPAAKPVSVPPAKYESQAPTAPPVAKAQPAESGDFQDNPNDISDPQKNNPNVFHFVAPREE